MFHVAGEAESAGARNIATVMSSVHVKRDFLAGGIYRRVFEINFKTQLEPLMGIQTRPFFLITLAFAHHHLFEDSHKTLGRVLQSNACALQQKHKGGGRAVKNWNLFGRYVYVQII